MINYLNGLIKVSEKVETKDTYKKYTEYILENYNLLSNNCSTFVYDVLNQNGKFTLRAPWVTWPPAIRQDIHDLKYIIKEVNYYKQG